MPTHIRFNIKEQDQSNSLSIIRELLSRLKQPQLGLELANTPIMDVEQIDSKNHEYELTIEDNTLGEGNHDRVIRFLLTCQALENIVTVRLQPEEAPR